MQVEGDPWAINAEYFPAVHDVHGPVPAATLYVPSAHGLQVPPFLEKKPGLQTHSVLSTLPGGDIELDGQSRQTTTSVAPTVWLYVAAEHKMHCVEPTVGLNFPGGH